MRGALRSLDRKAALRIQAVFRAKKARMRMRGVKAIAKAEEAGKPASTWIEEWDEASGYPYYTNTETGETTCDGPAFTYGRGRG